VLAHLVHDHWEPNLRRLSLALAAAGTLALGLAACGGDDNEEFCDKAAEVEQASTALQSIGGNDIEAAQDALDKANTQVQEVADSAPSEISDDVDTVAEFIDDLTAQVQEAKSPQDFLGLVSQLQGRIQDVQEASDNVDQYIADNC